MEPGFSPPTPIVGTVAFPEDNSSEDAQNHFTEISESRPLQSFDNEATIYAGGDVRSNYDTTEQMMSDSNLPEKRIMSSVTYDDLRKQNRDEYRIKSLGPGPSAISDEYGKRKDFCKVFPLINNDCN